MSGADTGDEGYDRGHLDGRIDARLAGHDAHFVKLNGTTAELVSTVHEMGMQVQRLADNAVADAATRVQLAAALRDADAVRRAADQEGRSNRAHRLSPVLVGVAIISVTVAVVSLVLSLVG